jgi:hypothetical protein
MWGITIQCYWARCSSLASSFSFQTTPTVCTLYILEVPFVEDNSHQHVWCRFTHLSQYGLYMEIVLYILYIHWCLKQHLKSLFVWMYIINWYSVNMDVVFEWNIHVAVGLRATGEMCSITVDTYTVTTFTHMHILTVIECPHPCRSPPTGTKCSWEIWTNFALLV